MRKVSGDVSVFGVPNLLQIFTLPGVQGYLTIREQSRRKIIHFSQAGIRLIMTSTKHIHPVGEVLLRQGKITREQLDELLRIHAETGRRVGELLVEQGLLTPVEVENTLRDQVAEEIYDLFTWRESTFEFAEDIESLSPEKPGPLAEITLDSNLISVMLEAVHRTDELAKIQEAIPSLSIIPERLEIPAVLDDPAVDPSALEAILPLVDGRRTVSAIIEDSLYPTFTVLRTLYSLTQSGAVDVRDGAGASTLSKKTPEGPKPYARGHSILLMSDLPTFRTELAVLLLRAGFDVVDERTSADIAEILSVSRVHLIVVDVSIDTEDGLGLCRRIRETTPLPLILLCGNASRQAVANATRSGARCVLTKPVKNELLLDRITSILRAEPRVVDKISAPK